MLFLCLHWCCSSSRCDQLQISLTYCLYSPFQIINNKDIKSGSTYLPLQISLGTCSQLFNTASCNSSARMTLQVNWNFFQTSICKKEWNNLLRDPCVTSTLLLCVQVCHSVQCGRIRLDWVNYRWSLCGFFPCLCSVVITYFLFDIFNFVIQITRLASLLACYNPEIQELHVDCTKDPSDPTSCCWQVTNSWYFRQKLGESTHSDTEIPSWWSQEINA